MSEELTVTEITETNPMQRELNKGMAVAWINDDLATRARIDIRSSYFFYDEDKDFYPFALTLKVNDDVLPILAEKTRIRYWSKGIV